MWVLECEGGFLGREGKHLHLAIVGDIKAASPFVKYEHAVDDGDRAQQILGVAFKPARHPVSRLIRKERPT